MATFSLAPKPDPNSIAQKLHDHYWNVMHRASYGMNGHWFVKMGSDPLNQIGKDNVASAEVVYQAGLDYCKNNNITVIENDPTCKKSNWNGVAYLGVRKIGLSPVRPDRIRFKYQHRLPTKEILARTIWHEIAHIELGHCHLGNKKPKSQEELEAEMVAYLVCLIKGRPYFIMTPRYIKRHFRTSHGMAKKALQSEVDVIKTVVKILGGNT